MDDKAEEILDRLDMLQSYVQHLGDRIDMLAKMQRRFANYDMPPPMQPSRRREKLMTLLSE